MPAVPKPRPVKDARYLAWVRTRPCVCSGWKDCNYDFSLTGTRQNEVNHLQGRSNDSLVIPLCPGHHRTNPVSWHHGQATFMAKYGWTKDQLLAHAEQLYRGWTA